MDWVRTVLERLGWPIASLSDGEIAHELHTRWFDQRGERLELEPTMSLAAANGIIVTMADQGNLDALCWSDQDDAPAANDLPTGDVPSLAHRNGGQCPRGELPHPDRRKSSRDRRSDLIRFTAPASSRNTDGWLVDVSAKGLAFIVETKDAPSVGTQIQSTLHQRDREMTDLGFATVVRTELLSDSLSLVCAQLEGTWEPSQ